MRPLELDYVVRPAWANAAGLSLLAFSLVLAASILALYFHCADTRDGHQARWDQLERSQKRLTGHAALSATAMLELQSEIRRANEVTAQLDLPWSQLFQAVEASGQETVALLGIQPDAQKRIVSIAAEAKAMPSAVEYVKRLGQSPVLSEIHIVNHQLQEQDPERPIRFSVQAVWRGRVREK